MAKKRRKSTKAKRPAVVTPVAGNGQKVFVLDVPYGESRSARDAGAEMYSGYGMVFIGAELPPALTDYAPKPYSLAAWLTDDLRGVSSRPDPDPGTGSFTLREDQEEDSAAIVTARQQGLPEFLLGSNVGVGKTPTTIAAVKRMPGVRTVLVVCPLPAAAGWRTHLLKMGDGGKRWCIVNYESTKKLLLPKSGQRSAGRANRAENLRLVQSGTPRFGWDVVIRDESHRCGNPESQQTRACDKIINNPPGHDPAFVVDLSATAGANPAKLSYLHRGLAARSGEPIREYITADDYCEWCNRRGIAVTRGGFGNALTWERNRSDLTKMNLLMFKGMPQWGARRIPDWPEQQRIPVPVDLTVQEMAAYKQEWKQFHKVMRQIEKDRQRRASGSGVAPPSGTDRAKGAAALMRYRQKAGMLRAQGTAAFVVEMIEKNTQVAISCEFLKTGEKIRKELEDKGIRVSMFTGDNRDTREDERIAFQQGRTKAIIFTTTEAVNFHAGETAAHGTTTQRVTVVAEARWSPTAALQVEGRTQRNGTSAPCYYTFATDTAEERVLRTVFGGMRDMATINGDQTVNFDRFLGDALGVPLVA